MTHKYLTQIRTIPNYHGDQSDFAKTWRSVNYTIKSASNLLIKNKKTRIIASVLGVYMILTSGFVVAFINVENNQANAQNVFAKSNLNINIKKQKVEAGNILLSLEVQNQTSETIVNPTFQFQSSFDNVQWTSATDSNNNKVDAQGSGFKLTNISPSQKAVYNVYGKLNNANVANVVVTSKASYFVNSQALEISSPKFLIDLK